MYSNACRHSLSDNMMMYYNSKYFLNGDVQALEWINTGKQNPADGLNDLIGEFGQPDVIDKNRDGMAVWSNHTLRNINKIYECVKIRDEQVPALTPVPHYQFVYVWLKLAVPKSRQAHVRALSDSITYDPLKQLVRVRCSCTGGAKAVLVLAKRIATGEMELKDAKKMVGFYVMATKPGTKFFDPEAADAYESELANYVMSTFVKH